VRGGQSTRRQATFSFGIGERWAVVSAIAYTVVNVMLRAAAPSIDATLGSLLRLLPLLVIAWAIVLRSGAHEFRPRDPGFLTWRLIGALLLGGSASYVVGNILYFDALNNGGLGITIGGVQAGSVLGGLWIGLLALREPPRRAQVAGAALIVAGLAAMAYARGVDFAGMWWLGLVLAFAAGTTYALSNATSRFVQRRRPLLFVTLAGSTVGGAVPLAVVVAGRALSGDTIVVDPTSASAVLAAGLANAVALSSLTLAVRSAPIASVNTISSASIVFSFVASVTVFGEIGTTPMILGIVLVTAGIVVAQLRRQPARSPVEVPPPAADATAPPTA
jgi:drug/metabolite transporter (DMT)-like permease